VSDLPGLHDEAEAGVRDLQGASRAALAGVPVLRDADRPALAGVRGDDGALARHEARAAADAAPSPPRLRRGHRREPDRRPVDSAPVAVERTLVLIKPDAVERGLAGEILGRFEARGLAIRAAKLLKVKRDLAREHYAEHLDKPFFGELVAF